MPIITEQQLIDAAEDAQDLSDFINETSDTIVTRLGNTLKTLTGHIKDMGYEVPVAYTDGLNISQATETVIESGVVYAPKPDSLPINPTPVSFDPDDWYPIQSFTHRTKLSVYGTISAALTAIGSNGEIEIDINETLPESTIVVPPGVTIITGSGVLTLQSGTTFHINGNILGFGQIVDATVGNLRIKELDVDIRWLGAVPETDAEVEINKAVVTAAVWDRAVYFPAGEWHTAAQILCSDNVRMYGSDPVKTVLKATAAMSRILYLSGADNVTIEGITLDGGGQAVTIGIDNRGDNNRFSNLIIHNTDATATGGNVLSTSMIGIDCNASGGAREYALIENNKFHNLGTCVRNVSGFKNLTVQNNDFRQFGVRAVYGNGATRITDGFVIHNNTVEAPLGGGVQSRQPVTLQSSAFKYTNVSCTDNRIIGDDLPYRAPTTLVATDPATWPAASERQYVKFTADATVNGQAVTEGDHWICHTTTAGGDAGDWERVNTAFSDCLSFHNVDGLLCNGNYVFGSGETGITVGIDSINIIISGNHLYSCDTTGISAGANSTTASNYLITNNIIHNCGRDQAEDHTNIGGMIIQDVDDAYINGNKISCDITSPANEQMPYGIVFDDATNINVGDNSISGFATGKYLEVDTVTYNHEQSGLADTGDIVFDPEKSGEITLSDGNGVLKLPTVGPLAGKETVLRIFGGYALDVSEFTVHGGSMYKIAGTPSAGILNIAKITYASDGTGYLRWDNGVVSMSNSERPSASSVPVGAFFYNTDDQEPNVSDGSNWRDMDGNTT